MYLYSKIKEENRHFTSMKLKFMMKELYLVAIISVIPIHLQPHLQSNKPPINNVLSTHWNIYLILMVPNCSRDKGRTGRIDDKFHQRKVISLLSIPFHVYCCPAYEATLFLNLKHVFFILSGMQGIFSA